MDLKGLIDCHTHCRFSPDGQDEPSKLVEMASQLGLKALAITDHCECNTWFEPEHYGIDSSKADPDDIVMFNCKSFHESSLQPMKELKNQDHGDLVLIHGIELGQPLQAEDIANELVSDKNIDFVIGSLHNNSGKPDFYYLEYDKMSPQQIDTLLKEYFDQVLEMCIVGKFDILGHLTYPLRYISGKYGISVDIDRYRKTIEKIFTTLISNNKGIEINTSGLYTDLKKTMPDAQLVKLYKDIGGEIISIGSDAHRAEDVGRGIAQGAQITKDCGFDHVAYFKNHEPVFVNL